MNREHLNGEQLAGNPSELDQIRTSILQMGERTDNQITQLMLMITGVARRLPPPPPETNPQSPEMAAINAKLAQLELSLARSERITSIGFDIDELCLFPNARLPKKFKPINFAKFDGTGDPKAHLTNYIGALSVWSVEKDAMAQMFIQTLVGHALHWFTALEITKKKSWEDICEAFVAQFDYNIQLEVTTRELESTKMELNESFVDFIRRWRAKTVQMKEKPSEKDQIQMILRNLQPALAKHMILAQVSSDFKTFFETGLAVEEAVQLGILENVDSFPESIVSTPTKLDASMISSKPTQNPRVDQSPNDTRDSEKGPEPSQCQTSDLEEIDECNEANP